MRRKVAGAAVGATIAALLAGCNATPDDVETAVSSASSVQSSVMASVESEASSAAAQATAALEEARAAAIAGTGAQIPAPPDFNPLHTGFVYAGDYTVTATTGEQLRDGYASIGDSVEFDLSGLAPLPADRTVNIYTDGAAVIIYLPTEVRVRTKCTATHAIAECTNELHNPQAASGILTLEIETIGGDIAAIESQAMQ
ncbi:hypothetical protein FRX94_08205 [Corynebacterium canis]|uniref:Lipoprotein n=1 Tax=Corynebacterium canis TaxID=679663 RepID=A0A5C5UD13_9CORY|nr:hypothetical protein [Corynebacterium canis]TWT24441.1 hypothetical protein FRX94_08205 [Corynebacterium canis]WJY74323.1 hypothetical protein CCANI_02325 [Corynebacterium canis]